MAQVTGIVYVKVDGELFRSKEGAKLSLGGKERSAQVGHSVYGYAEKVVPASLEFSIAHVGGDDLIGIQNKIDSTLEFETDTGDTYMVKDAFCTNPSELSGGEGEATFKFEGRPAELV